ncbi:hypothetical protein Q1695_000210 [Nippostrongylus brasiliensis]|nr:hypothetical protein Q1695_000210 [Nippostrongylus brasiliensis]
MVKNEVETKNERGKPEHSAATSVSPDSPTNQQQRTHSSHTASTSTKTREPEPALLKKARSRSSDGFRESGRVGDPENVRVTVVKSENRRVIKEESWRRGARRDLSREFHDERSRSPHPSSRVDDRKRFEDRSRSDHRPNNLFGASRIDEFLNERWERYPSYDRYDEYRH